MPILKVVDTDFFKKWSSEMAYVLGFFAADGNMIQTKRKTHFISFYSADKKLIADIKEVMGSEHKISKRVSDTGCVYRLQIGSKVMYEDLVALGFSGRKTDRMRLPNIPKKLLQHFVRGYFDGDGNVWTGYVNKKRARPTYVLQVSFTSGSKNFLDSLWESLQTIGIQGGSLYT